MQLSTSSESILTNSLISLAHQIHNQIPRQADFPISMLLSGLGNYYGASDTSVANTIRLDAGGALEQYTESGEEVEDCLRKLARDFYPLLLTHKANAFDHASWPSHNNPTIANLAKALKQDSALSRFIPASVDNGQHQGNHQEIFEAMRVGQLAESIIRSSWYSAERTSDTPTFSDLLGPLHENIEITRKLASGNRVEIYRLSAFTGIQLPSEASIPTPWGYLRSLKGPEHKMAPPGLQGTHTTDQDGEQITISGSGELILETKQYLSAKFPSSGTEDYLFRTFEKEKLKAEHVEILQIATLLTIDLPADKWAILQPTWTWTGNPLTYPVNVSWRVPALPSGVVPYRFSYDDCTQLAIWIERVNKHWDTRIEIAIRRAISAVKERNNPTDRLVDSVIAWENLFSGDVSGSMAWLLEPKKMKERIELRERAKDIYGIRNDILHGRPPKVKEVEKYAHEAMGLAIRSLRALFRDRQDLISMDAIKRSPILLMGG